MRGKLMIFILIFISMFLFFSCSNDPVNAMIENTTSILVKNETSNNNTATASMTLIAQNDAENEEETETEELLETEIDYETIADTVFKNESYTYKSKYRKDPFVSVLELQREGLNEIEIETASYFGMIQGE
ncbi:hypothetical protein KAU15_06725, partial [candidate division WOR-3 bacterium]|nr:hypothetical protein [candidate division WOR-3 bacterium]